MNFENKDSNKPKDGSWLKEHSVELGLLLIATLSFLAQNTLPQWMVWVSAVCLIIFAAATIFPVAQKLFRQIKKEHKLSAARKHLPELLREAKEFRRLTDQQNTNSLLYLFSQTAQWKNDASLLPPSEHVEVIRSWLFALERRTEHCKKRDFLMLCREFGELVYSYTRLLAERTRVLQNTLRGGGMDAERTFQLKQTWNVNRGTYLAFLNRWETIAKTINHEIGTQTCLEYYDSLNTLE